MLDYIDGCAIGGCLPDEPGQDFPTLQKVAAVNRTASVDLRPWCTPVEDQRKVGSCVANAVVGALEYQLIKRGLPVQELSRLFVYYNARKLSGQENVDSGSSRRLAMAAVLAWGVCPEPMWPYQAAMVNEIPTRDCYAAAERFRGIEFADLSHGDPVKDALASGLPVVFGMAVPPSFSQVGSHMRPPANGQWEPPGGGHAMLIVGYDDRENAFLIRNSWGTSWGEEGYCWMDYDVLMHYTQPPVYSGNRPFVIGNIADNRAYQTLGTTPQQFMQAMESAASPALRADFQSARQAIASELDESLSKARQSIRDRLRGPGAGGGY